LKIGIDIGNVIIGGGGEDTFFTDDYLSTPEVEGAWDALDNLDMAKHELHIISKCGLAVEEKSLHWLESEQFFLSVPRHRTHFVRKRPLKAPMAQALELDIFIDDRQDIIDSLQGVVKYPILFTSWEQTNAELELIFASQG
jgi:hypothetical protein